MKNTPDDKLILLAMAGDAEAFECLVQRHYMLVYRCAFKWCGHKEDAEDITQEVFVKIAGKLHSFKGESRFTTWLYRVTLNSAKDFLRKRARRDQLETGGIDEQTIAAANPGPEAAEPAAALQAALCALPDKQRQAVLLVFGEGLSHKEAARVLGCAETTVSWRVFQARRRLKKLMP